MRLCLLKLRTAELASRHTQVPDQTRRHPCDHGACRYASVDNRTCPYQAALTQLDIHQDHGISPQVAIATDPDLTILGRESMGQLAPPDIQV